MHQPCHMLPHSNGLNFYQSTRSHQCSHLHRAARRLVRLLCRSEELYERRIHPRKVHLAAVAWVARQKHVHHHHVCHRQLLRRKHVLDLLQHGSSLRLRIAVHFRAALGSVRISDLRNVTAHVDGVISRRHNCCRRDRQICVGHWHPFHLVARLGFRQNCRKTENR